MIYCVVPEALADEIYDKLVDYYRDDPNVKVIVDRRAPRGQPSGPGPGSEPSPARRERDRRPAGERPDAGAPAPPPA